MLGIGIVIGVGIIVGVCMCIIGCVDVDLVGLGLELMVVDMLEGNCVVNFNGEDFGKIIDIMFDVQCGWIVYVVMLVGGFLGIGDKLFVVLWSVMLFDVDCKCFVFDVNKDCFEVVLGFDKDSWFMMVDFIWVQFVYEYYGLCLYWEEY